MLRPERMSKVSVTGSKRVLDDVIEAVHDLNLLHISEYDGSWEGFSPGNPIDGAEETSEKLVTVRALESVLDLDPEDAGARKALSDDDIEAELDEIRERVNELDDRREELKDELREIDEEIDAMEPFVDLGIELDLLSGYDTLEVAVGLGKPKDVEEALSGTESIGQFELFSGDRTVAVFARPETDSEDPIADALVGVDFQPIDVPTAEGSPEDYVRELRSRRRQLDSKLDNVESELEVVKREAADFLLAAEEELSIDAQKRDAPLSFATTANAFVAEGWIPTERYEEFEGAIRDAVGDHAEVEEIERAAFTPDGDHHNEAVGEAAADGGYETSSEKPPVVQDNPTIASPFETLVNAVSRPKYSEFDPTLLVFLTFPLMFGFMISDIGYGILYVAIGYYFWKTYDTSGMKNVGAVAMWAGGFTIFFGFPFGGDVFGHHLLDTEMAKGVAPGYTSWAQAWLVVTVLFGVLHLNVGYVLSFVSTLQHHDFKHAMYEAGSWLLLLNGLWVWVFSAHYYEAKPEILFAAFETTLGIQTQGLPEIVGIVGLLAVAVGAVLLAIGEPQELPEVLSPLVNAVSYTRMTAVLLAKGGMAVAANLLAFGAYIEDGSFVFMFTPSNLAEAQAAGQDIVFAGLTTQGAVGVVGGILVAILGHIVVLMLGITAAGIQGIRLEYVEFFNKFYEGGGRKYDPFGYVRRFTRG